MSPKKFVPKLDIFSPERLYVVFRLIAGTAAPGLRIRGIRPVCRHAFLMRDRFRALVVLWMLIRLLIPLLFMGGSRFRILRGHVVLLTRDVVA